MRSSCRFAVALAGALVASTAIALQPDREISQYAHRAWGIENGLPNSVVRSIVQSDDGYLWIATYDGLARYNGESFTRFDKNTSPALRRDTILSLQKSRDGSLWIGTNGGGAVRLRNGKFERFGKEEGLPSDIVPAFAEDHNGTMWIGTSEGLARFQDGRIRKQSAGGRGGEAISVLSLAVLEGNLWIGTRGDGLYVLHPPDVFAMRHAFAGRSVHTLLAEADGTLLIGSSDGLSRWNGTSVEPVPSFPPDPVTAILRDSDRTLWIGTYSLGLFRIGADGALHGYSSAEGLLNNSVRAIFEDSEKTLWVGTNGGLESFRVGRFVTYGVVEGLSDAYVRSVYEDRAGNIWIGTARGLNKLSGSRVTTFTTQDGLANDYIFTVVEGRDGSLWIGTPTGLNRWLDGKFTRYTSDDGLPRSSVRALFVARDGVVWVGTDEGAARFVDGRFERVTPGGRWDATFVQAFAEGPDGSVWLGADGQGIARYHDGRFTTWTERNGLPDMHILSLLVDRSGTVWMGTDGAGLIRFKDGRFTAYTTRSGIPGDKILQIVADAEGRLWCGAGRGIWSVPIAELDAFAAGKIKRLSPSLYGVADGIRAAQCNGSVSPSAFRTRDGRLWFPTVDGVAVTDPKGNQVSPLPPPPVTIESVIVDGRALDLRDGITIPPGSKHLEIHYAALTYASPERAQFRYQLEGYDGGWVEVGHRRVAYYTSLPPDRYRFRVIASNANEVWNENGAAMSVVVKPRFVQTLWFAMLVVAFVAAAVILFHLRRVHVMKRREKELVAVVEERTSEIQRALGEAETARERAERNEQLLATALVQAEAANRAKNTFLANVSHELRTPLNSIIGFADILDSGGEETLSDRQRRFINNISLSGNHLLALINEILDLAKIEAGKMTLDLQPVVMSELLEGVTRVIKGLTVARTISFEVEIAADVGRIIADPVKLKQVIYNLVSNAVKFSPDRSTVRLTASRLPADQSPIGKESLAIAVIDQGIGIDPEDHEAIFEEFRQVHAPTEKRPPGTGLGLALVRKLVEMHGGIVSVTSRRGAGATFTAIVPTNTDASRAHSGPEQLIAV